MARSEHWKKAVPLIQQWVECRFAKSGMSPWDYIDGRMNLDYVGIHRANFMKELAPLIPETKRQVGTTLTGGTMSTIASITFSIAHPISVPANRVLRNGRDLFRRAR